MTPPGRQLILASGSPRRRELLEGVVGPVLVTAPDVDETPHPGESAETLVVRLAEAKARAVAVGHPSGVVIGADTVVVVDGAILGKPVDEADARRMLSLLSGRSHSVMSGLAVVSGDRIETDCVVTEVTFRSLEPHEIEWYVATGDPLDKAGAYGIQGRGALFVTGIVGSYHNVVGLPLQRLDALCTAAGRPLVGTAP